VQSNQDQDKVIVINTHQPFANSGGNPDWPYLWQSPRIRNILDNNVVDAWIYGHHHNWGTGSYGETVKFADNTIKNWVASGGPGNNSLLLTFTEGSTEVVLQKISHVDPFNPAFRAYQSFSVSSPYVSVTCGDGMTNYGEECDDGNQNNNDDCTNECLFPFCGDAVMWNQSSGSEVCDDGGVCVDDPMTSCTEHTDCRTGICAGVAGDGCSDTCTVEPGFVCDEGEPTQCVSLLECADCGFFGGWFCFREACESIPPDNRCYYDEWFMGGGTCSECDEATSCEAYGSDQRSCTDNLCGFDGCAWENNQCITVTVCGNGVAEGIEECDGNDLRDRSCLLLDYPRGGSLACHPAQHVYECTFNVSECSLLPTWSTFDGRTTNFDEQPDIGRVANAVLETEAFGRLNFTKILNFTRLDLDRNVDIGDKVVRVNLSGRFMVHVNVSVNITFYHVHTDNISILRNGVPCADCRFVDWNGTAYTVEVPHFTNYSLISNQSNCTPQWQVFEWGPCTNGQRTRVVVDANACGTEEGKPATSESCTPPGGSSSSGSSGGSSSGSSSSSSSGGYYNPPPLVTSQLFTGQHAFQQVKLDFTEPVEAQDMAIRRHQENPTRVNVDGLVYAYVEIAHSIPDNIIEKVTIIFHIRRDWLESNNILVETVQLYHFDGGEWAERTTRLLGSTDDKYVFEAGAPHLSYFAVGGQVSGEEIIREEQKNVTPPQPLPDVPTPEPERNILPWVVAVIIILVLTTLFMIEIIHVLRKRRT